MPATERSWKVDIDYTRLPDIMHTRPTNDPKYVGWGGLIYNRATGVPIPLWEPTFLFRAKDEDALEALQFYAQRLSDKYEIAKTRFGPTATQTQEAAHHLYVVNKRVAEFAQFVREYPTAMQAPTTALPSA